MVRRLSLLPALAWSLARTASADVASEASGSPATAPGSAAQGQIVVSPPPASDPPPDPPPEPATPPDVPPPAAPPPAPALAPQELTRDEGVEGAAVRPSREHDFFVELDLALNTRLGSAAGFREQERIGAAFGGGFWLLALDQLALGLEISHAELGRGSDQEDQELVSVEYSATTAWLGGRFTPWKLGELEPFIALRAGLALQHVDAEGLRQVGSDLSPPRGFACTDVDGPSLAVGAGLGASLGLGPRVRLIGRFDASAQQLTGDLVGGCAVGVGSAASLAFGLGLSYGFGGPSVASQPFAGSVRPGNGRGAQTW